MDSLVKILEGLGLPFAYDTLRRGKRRSRNFAANGQVSHKISEVRLEVYTDRKDLGLEARVEDVLDAHGIFYNKYKVKFNLRNAHYAMLSVSEESEVSYETLVPMPGSVSISLDANREPENFYADGVAYYVLNNNMGYDGDLELVMIPESFRTDVLGRSWMIRTC